MRVWVKGSVREKGEVKLEGEGEGVGEEECEQGG